MACPPQDAKWTTTSAIRLELLLSPVTLNVTNASSLRVTPLRITPLPARALMHEDYGEYRSFVQPLPLVHCDYDL